MSIIFSQHIASLIEDEISSIIQKISEHFNISADEISQVIRGENISEKKTKKSPVKPKSAVKKPESPKKSVESSQKQESEDVPEDAFSLSKYAKPQLSGILKKKGLKCTGTRDELVNRILEANKNSNKEEAPSSSESSSKAPAKKVQSTLVKKTAPKQEPSILKKINQTAPTLQIKRNKWGNYEHTESHLVFDKEDRIVIGKQLDDGTVIDIDDDDIETCKKYKFNYTIPENLDKNKKNVDDVAIEELEEELDEEDFEEEIEEEEELSDEDDE